jgi:glycolate oxidase iron-sulfur subunit
MPAPRPSTADPLVALADRCVQCGLCLPACPTYRHDRLETESPRGRIALARAWALGVAEPTAAGDAHLDHCLACRGCEAACPAGVEFGALLVEARTRQRLRRRAPWQQRAIEALAARPRLLDGLLALYRRAFPVLPGRLRALPRPPAPGMRASAPPRGDTAAALFVGCVARAYEPAARAALARLCDAAGIALVVPEEQTCCGALHAHAGDGDTAAALVSTNRAAFARTSQVLTLASGCHATLQAALDGQAPVIDAVDALAARLDRLRFRELRERIAMHLPCTQRHTTRSAPALQRLLARVPGLDVVVLDAGPGCCGAAGSQMLLDPERAARYRQPLVEQARASGATRLLSANLGCRLHLAGASPLPVQHPLELLAEALDA